MDPGKEFDKPHKSPRRERSGSSGELSPMPSGSGQSGNAPLFEKDYQRIHTLMQNKGAVLDYLQPLDQRLQTGVRLKDALYQSEQAHGFAPEIHRIGGGLESKEQFMGTLKTGMMFKDRGAARDHGEYTHRLQWYAVARDMEAHPEAYSTTKSADLYRGLAARFEQGKTGKHNWMSMFDENKTTGDFRQPETLTASLLQQDAMPHLKQAMQHEQNKRRTGFMDMFGAYKKGPERNAAIQQFHDIGLTKYDHFKTPESHTPRVRGPGEQPKTGVGYPTIQPVVRGSKKSSD